MSPSPPGGAVGDRVARLPRRSETRLQGPDNKLSRVLQSCPPCQFGQLSWEGKILESGFGIQEEKQKLESWRQGGACSVEHRTNQSAIEARTSQIGRAAAVHAGADDVEGGKRPNFGRKTPNLETLKNDERSRQVIENTWALKSKIAKNHLKRTHREVDKGRKEPAQGGFWRGTNCAKMRGDHHRVTEFAATPPTVGGNSGR